MIFINVTGHICEQKDCSNDLEAQIYLLELKERHLSATREFFRNYRHMPGPYFYNIRSVKPGEPSDIYYTSFRWQQDTRVVTSKFPLKVEISAYEDMGDLV